VPDAAPWHRLETIAFGLPMIERMAADDAASPGQVRVRVRVRVTLTL
jgi:hypothetical protein